MALKKSKNKLLKELRPASSFPSLRPAPTMQDWTRFFFSFHTGIQDSEDECANSIHWSQIQSQGRRINFLTDTLVSAVWRIWVS